MRGKETVMTKGKAIIREAREDDLQQLLGLYLFLHEKEIPKNDEYLRSVWKQISEDPNHHLIVAQAEGRIVSSCCCVIIPNLTRNARPYALIENVVTHAEMRGRGLATACLDYATSIAREKGCYKIMLMTGSREEATLNFYRRAGFDSGEKTAFLRRL